VNGSGASLTVPPGALSADTSITVSPSTAEVPAGYTALSPVFTLSPAGTILTKAATIDIALSTPGAGVTVFLSNAGGGYDALPTTVTTTGVSAPITRLGNCFAGFAGHGPGGSDGGSESGAVAESGTGTDGASGDDASPADSATATDASSGGPETGAAESGVAEAAAAEAGAPDTGAVDGGVAEASAVEAGAGDGAAGDAGAQGITVQVNGTPTTFAANASVVDLNGVWRIQADDSASTTHWTLQITSGTSPQAVCSSSLAYPAINYTHYTSGTADSVYSTQQTQGYCTITAFAPQAHGDLATGSFSGGVDRAADAGGGDYLFTSGTYSILY
jgi:hypothetical protein